jgi:cytoskeletal protein RodZ
MPSTNRNRPARQRRTVSGNESYTPAPKQPVPVYTAHEPAPGVERIGDILRRRRQQRGDDLQQIADYLCIRKSFLVALEESAYDELPADAYVIGFLRSYAAYLGFDGGDAINRYRGEMTGRRRKPALVLPTPITEGRTPSVLIMVAAATVAVLIYILWYGLSSADRAVVSAPPPMPTAPTVPAREAAAAAPVPGGIALSSSPPSETASPVAAAASAPQAPLAAAPPPPAQGLAIPAPAVAAPAPVAATAVPVAAAPPPAAEAPAAPPSRLVVRAEKESWVVIADGKGHTLLDRVMKPGDTFAVPDQEGLKLTTGNSGGIVLVLDGKDLPKLTRSSSILHDIPLDLDKLAKATSGKPKPAKPAAAAEDE